MALVNIDTQLLRSFITIVDAGGFAKAADLLHMTQPAISQQMKRLEDAVRQPLFRRSGRIMRLTADGEIMLGYARQIVEINDTAVSRLSRRVAERDIVVLGMPAHFSETMLHLIIARAAADLPQAQLVVRIASSRNLHDRVEQGELDLALVLGEELPNRSHLLQQVPVSWIAGQASDPDRAADLPLVLFNMPCTFRNLIIRTLDAAGMPVGLQLLGQPGTEGALLALAQTAEAVLGTANDRLGRPAGR